MERRVVIVGGGIAGVTFAETLRAQDPSAEIFLFESEPHPLYSRVLLPHYVKGKIPREKVFLRTLDAYMQKNISYFPGVSVVRIDADRHVVFASNGMEVSCTHLVFATGTEARRLPDFYTGMHYLATLADADGVVAHDVSSRVHEPALVYGAGFIACEFINALVALGALPTLLVRGSGFWSRTLLADGQEFLREVLRAHRISFFENVGDITPLAFQDIFCGVRDAHDRTYAGTFLGVGIGAMPCVSLAQRLAVLCDEGILTKQGVTNIPWCFALGDVAQSADDALRARTHGNWAHAQQEGRFVAQCISSALPGSFPTLSQYSTELLGCPIVFLGDVSLEHAQETHFFHEDGGYVQVFLRDAMLVGVVLLGSVRARAHFVSLLGKPYASS